MPQDTFNEEDVAIGIRYPMQLGGRSGGFFQTMTTIQDVTSQIHVLLRTQKGERINNPDFGTDIHRLLFENYQTEEELIDILRQNIEEPIRQWINPPININNIDITFQDFNRANVSIDFELQSNPDESGTVDVPVTGQ